MKFSISGFIQGILIFFIIFSIGYSVVCSMNQIDTNHMNKTKKITQHAVEDIYFLKVKKML